MKLVITEIAEPLCKLINNSFSSGIVPDELKIAKVCPVYKNGDRAQFCNYCPISILPSFSKIYEKLVYNKLTNYVSKHLVLHNNQYGFRSQHDTCMAVIDMVDKITNAICLLYTSPSPRD